MSGQARHVASQLRATAVAASSLLGGQHGTSGAVVLAYHDVLPDDAAPQEYAVSRSLLRRHLDVVARLGLRVVSLRHLAGLLRSGADVTGHVALAFDDALVGVHQLAMPELAERGWTATLHPVMDRLGLEPPWWPGSRRAMTWTELQEAVALGLEVGGHGTTHDCLPCLSSHSLKQQLRDPRSRLEDLLGRPVRELAYPFGHYDRRVRETAVEAGYTTAFTFLNGRITTDVDRWELPRLTMHQGLSPLRLAQQLARRPGDWPARPARAVHPTEPHVGGPGPDAPVHDGPVGDELSALVPVAREVRPFGGVPVGDLRSE